MPINLPPKIGEKKMDLRNVKVVNIGSSQEPVNFMDALTLLFIGLKLTGHLDSWTWVEVLSPLWGPLMVAWFLRLVVASFFSADDEEDE